MILWRISNFADLNGIGGTLYSGRWHNAPRAVVYLSENPEGALLETLAHLDSKLARLPLTLQMLRIEAQGVVSLLDAQPPERPDWTANLSTSQAIGDDWLDGGRSALLRVPSAILPMARNVLFNPLHPDARAVRITDVFKVPLDARLKG